MKTGNRKVWKVVKAETGETIVSGLTKGEAEDRCRGENYGCLPCMDGFKVVACNGEAHGNAHIDHCMVCLGYHWGYNMVPDGSVTFWFDLCKEARENLWNSKLDYKDIAGNIRELDDLARACFQRGI